MPQLYGHYIRQSCGFSLGSHCGHPSFRKREMRSCSVPARHSEFKASSGQEYGSVRALGAGDFVDAVRCEVGKFGERVSRLGR